MLFDQEKFRFHHIGVVVKRIDTAVEYFKSILPIKEVGELIIDSNIDVKIKFLTDSSGICYEIIAPLSSKSPICSALKSKKNILNHIAYEVENLQLEIDKYCEKGLIQLGPTQKAIAFEGREVCFFMTKQSVIIELIQA